MDIDIVLEPDFTPDELAELCALAENYGIRTVWASNFESSRDVFMSLCLAARSTSKIKLGALAVSPFELHPIKMANSLFALNELSKGRASILVGGGGAVLGAMQVKPSRRVRAVRECVEILKQVSADRPLAYEGEIYRMSRYQPTWATDDPPLVYVGANYEQMFRMFTQVADGLMMSDIPLPLIGDAVKTIQDALASNGRTDQDFSINNFWAWHVKEDKAQAIAEARSRLAVRGMLMKDYLAPFLSNEDCDLVQSHMGAFFKAYTQRTPVIENVPERIIETLVDSLTLTADLSELDEKIHVLKEFQAAGLTEITLGLHDDPAASIKVIGERVLPVLA